MEKNQAQRELVRPPLVRGRCSQPLANPVASPATVTLPARTVTLAVYQRRRDTDWVQAASWLRCSISLATSGAPIRAPITASAAGGPATKKGMAKLDRAASADRSPPG